MRRAIREHRGPVITIVLFAIVSSILGAYTLSQQRLQSPLTDRYDVRVAFTATPGLAPGLGQAANVAGVRVGQITDAEVRDGRSIVTLSIERDRLPRVYADASAALRPKTPLQELQVELDPGRPPAPPLAPGRVIGLGRTAVPIGADQLLSALDGDTRQYLTALITGAGAGLDGRGPDLRALLKATGPTARQVRELGAALSGRRRALARTVHALSALAVATGERDDDLRRAVSAGSATLQAIAAEDGALRETITRLPGTLATTRSSLRSAAGVADELRPTLRALTPTLRALPGTLQSASLLARRATPALRRDVRPLVRTALPALRPVPDAARRLHDVTPDLENAFGVLEYATNELFFNDGGRRKSYAYWLAWAQHNTNSVLSTGDAHGQVVRSALIFSCSTFRALPILTDVLDGAARVLPAVCPQTEGAK